MRLRKPSPGLFPNTMAYVRWGDGPKTLLVIPGGPGNTAPRAAQVAWMGRSLRPLVENGYSLWMVTRPRGMPQGHTMEDMADDYADLIATEFHGHVDLVVGISNGGAIGLYLAANHPEVFGNIALVAGAHTFDEFGLRLDHAYASALSRGRPFAAGRLMAGAMLSGSRLRWIAPLLGTVMGWALRPDREHDEYRCDVMVEADAEMALDARPILSRIGVPVLLVGGDRDFYLPVSLIEETARLIPDCTLVLYPGKSHEGAIRSRSLAADILAFVDEKPAVAA